MRRSIVTTWMVLCALVPAAGCDDESDPATPTDGVQTAPEPPPPVEDPAPAPEAPQAQGLPRAEDVLPSGEVSQGSLAVLADGYRFQVPEGFEPAEVDVEGAEQVYAGDVDGIISPTRLTFYVTHEPFDGDTAAYVAQRKEQLSGVEGNELHDMPPAFMKVAGQGTQGIRWRVSNQEGIELQQAYVHEGTAYTLHCAIPAQPNGWPNVGSDCMAKGATFHIAPPAD